MLRAIVDRNPAGLFDGGEPLDRFADRALDAIRHIARRNAGRRVLVVTHGWVMDVVTRESQHLPRGAILNHKRKNIECLWIEVTGRGVLAGSKGRSE